MELVLFVKVSACVVILSASVFRYVSGAVVLPASVRDFESVIKSVRLCAFPEYDYHHRALYVVLLYGILLVLFGQQPRII